HQHVRGVGAGTVHAEEAAPRDAVVVLARFADGALAAADPRIDELLLPDLDPFGPRAERLHHPEGFVSGRKGRYAAAVLHVKALAGPEIEVAIPDVQVGVAYARARNAHQDFGSLRLGRLLERLLQRSSVLDDFPAQHEFSRRPRARRLRLSLGRLIQRLVDVPEDVVERLEPD